MLRQRIILLAASLTVAPAATSFESHWTSHLDVRVQQMEGWTAINGMSIAMERAEGMGVGELAARILEDWQRESGASGVLKLSLQDWSLITRIHQGRSEVVQWRGVGAGAELIWSSTDLEASPRAVPAGLVSAPAGCSWMPPIHGYAGNRPFLQRTARCRQDPQILQRRLSASLKDAGWELTHMRTGILQATRNGVVAQLQIDRATFNVGGRRTEEGTALVVIEIPSPQPGTP